MKFVTAPIPSPEMSIILPCRTSSETPYPIPLNSQNIPNITDKTLMNINAKDIPPIAIFPFILYYLLWTIKYKNFTL